MSDNNQGSTLSYRIEESRASDTSIAVRQNFLVDQTKETHQHLKLRTQDVKVKREKQRFKIKRDANEQPIT